MKIPRQTERRARFEAALNNMPRWETWITEHEVLPEGFTEDEAAPVTVKRHHVRLIPRRVRRDMARKKSLKGFRVEHRLPEPR